MFSVPLELPEFKVVKQVFHEEFFQLNVVKKSTDERCPYCGFLTNHVHDRRTRKVRDLKVLDKPLFLFVQVNRFRCFNCDEVFTQTFESIQPNKHQTNRYREYLYEQCLGSTIKMVSEKENIPYTTLERLFYSIATEKEIEHINELEENLRDEELVISIDEVAVRKGHRYETVLMDAKTGRVLAMEENRSFESTQLLLTKNLLSQSCVETVVVDMWKPFHKAVQTLFPAACLVIDKYHVVQKVTQALDQVRKLFPTLKKGRFALLKGYENLTEQQKQQLEGWLDEHDELALAYYLKESFRDFYQASDYDTAEELLDNWINEAKASPFRAYQEVARTLEKWKASILQYFLTPYTNGRIEGTNHKIKNIKRRAYGFRNIQRFRLRVFLECTGKTNEKQAA